MTGIQTAQISSARELEAAVTNLAISRIEVVADLAELASIRLAPGQSLCGARRGVMLRFAANQDGVQLSRDNQVTDLRLVTDPDQRAICNDTSIETLGRIELHRLAITGVVQLLAADKVKGGHLEAQDIDIEAADARGFAERPKGYGVEVIQGAFTLWNRQPDPKVVLSASLGGLSAGREGAPVRGSGIFVGGGVDAAGRISVSRLETGPVYSDGGIAPGTPDRITGGVFVVHGAHVAEVRNLGPVTTYGPNDMVLDNWGSVDRWVAESKITSFGPSGIGLVNFGRINRLQVAGVIETFGGGARGFNVYTGTVEDAKFERVVTHADGAVGIQISQPIGRLVVRRGVETFGGKGESLVKGVVIELAAIALSIKPGGTARKIEIAGGLITHGAGIPPLELHGAIDELAIGGGFSARGGGFEAI